MKILSKISVAIFIFIICYFVYQAFRINYLQIGEVDSLTYHIPLAQNFASGNFTNLLGIKQGLGFYPGMGEVILSLFVILHLPLGLFNVLGIVLLYIACKKLGEVFGLNKEYATIFSVSIISLPTIIRLIPIQTIDIWLAIFFVWTLILLNQPKKEIKYFLFLGFSIGLLIGVKYSGVLLAFGLLIFYFKKLYKFLSPKNIIFFLFPILIFGFSWFIRNYFITGNPFYPVWFFGFKGAPNYIPRWISWNVITQTKYGFLLTIQSLLSEYLFWSLSPLIIFLLYLYLKKKKQLTLLRNYSKLIYLSAFNVLVFLPQPSGLLIQTTTSIMRFLYPVAIPLILFVFILFEKINKTVLLATIAILSSISFLPQLSFYPKLILIWLMIMFAYLFNILNNLDYP